jgi:hypothetical protein
LVDRHALPRAVPQNKLGEKEKMKKAVTLLCLVFAAALAHADSINETFPTTPITTQGAYWGFNNGPDPAIAFNLTGGNTATLQLGSVVFNAGNVVASPDVWGSGQQIFITVCDFGCRQQYVGFQSYGGDSNNVTGSILAGQLVPCASGHGECRVTNGTFSFNYGGNYSYGYYGNHSNNYLNSGSVQIGEVAAVPEPGTLGLMGTGLVGLAFLTKRKLAAAFISAA